MKRFFVKALISGMVSMLLVLASAWIAGACMSGFYQPDCPRE